MCWIWLWMILIISKTMINSKIDFLFVGFDTMNEWIYLGIEQRRRLKIYYWPIVAVRRHWTNPVRSGWFRRGRPPNCPPCSAGISAPEPLSIQRPNVAVKRGKWRKQYLNKHNANLQIVNDTKWWIFQISSFMHKRSKAFRNGYFGQISCDSCILWHNPNSVQ